MRPASFWHGYSQLGGNGNRHLLVRAYVQGVLRRNGKFSQLLQFVPSFGEREHRRFNGRENKRDSMFDDH